MEAYIKILKKQLRDEGIVPLPYDSGSLSPNVSTDEEEDYVAGEEEEAAGSWVENNSIREDGIDAGAPQVTDHFDGDTIEVMTTGRPAAVETHEPRSTSQDSPGAETPSDASNPSLTPSFRRSSDIASNSNDDLGGYHTTGVVHTESEVDESLSEERDALQEIDHPHYASVLHEFMDRNPGYQAEECLNALEVCGGNFRAAGRRLRQEQAGSGGVVTESHPYNPTQTTQQPASGMTISGTHSSNHATALVASPPPPTRQDTYWGGCYRFRTEDVELFMPENVPYMMQVFVFDNDDPIMRMNSGGPAIDKAMMTGEKTSISSIEESVATFVGSRKPNWVKSTSKLTTQRFQDNVYYQIYLEQGNGYRRLEDDYYETSGARLIEWMEAANERALIWLKGRNQAFHFNVYKESFRYRNVRFYAYLKDQKTEFEAARDKHMGIDDWW